MPTKNILETRDDTLWCDNCAFDADCEQYLECVANYIRDEKLVHLRYCENKEFEKLSEEEKKEFLAILEEKYKRTDSESLEKQLGLKEGSIE